MSERHVPTCAKRRSKAEIYLDEEKFMAMEACKDDPDCQKEWEVEKVANRAEEMLEEERTI